MPKRQLKPCLHIYIQSFRYFSDIFDISVSSLCLHTSRKLRDLQTTKYFHIIISLFLATISIHKQEYAKRRKNSKISDLDSGHSLNNYKPSTKNKDNRSQSFAEE